MSSPTVSIGLPVFNGEQYLDEAIESLVNQTFCDIEIIISDNGSTDSTPEICRTWAQRDPRIRFVRSDVNQGASWNFNRVFELAQGEYFKWAAHDDWVQPTWVARCIEALEDDPGVVLAYTKALMVKGSEPPQQGPYDYPACESLAPIDRFRSVVELGRCIPVFGLIRSDALQRTHLIGPYDSSDRVLLAELSLFGRFERVDEPLFLHREHPGRSMRAYATRHERGAWFDPRNANPLTYWPTWRYYANFLGAVKRSQLGVRDKLSATRIVASQMMARKRALAVDVVTALRQIREAGARLSQARLNQRER